MAAARSYTFKLTSEGVDKLKKDLEALGPAGVKAFEQVRQFAPQFEDAFKRAEKQVDAARKSIDAANENIPKGFAKVGAAAEALESQTKKATRGLNDVRGTLELLGPLAGEAGGAFGNLVRTVGNFSDAFGVASTLIRANPIGVLVTVLGVAATAWLTLGGNINQAKEADEAYNEAIKKSNALNETAAEKAARLAEAERQGTIETNKKALALNEVSLAQLKNMRLTEQMLLLTNPQLKRDESIFAEIDKQIAERGAKVLDLKDKLERAQDPTQTGTARDAADKAEAEATAEAQKQYLQNIDDRIAAEEEAMRQEAGLRLSNHQLQLKIEQDFSAAQQKLAEEDAKVIAETNELRNRQIIADQEKLEREAFGPGAQRAVQDYWESLAQHGKRAGQFVSNSVLRPMEDSLTKFLSGGKVKFSDFFDSLKMGLARLAAQDLIGGIGAALGLGGGSGGSAIGAGVAAAGSWIGSLLGFKDGGTFMVGGGGGTDSQVVSFRATPGERVTITTPQQAADGAHLAASRLRSMGEGNDTELIHISREEIAARRLFGPGKINRRTGLLGFDFGLGGGDPSNDDGSTGGYGGGVGGYGGGSGEGGLEGLEGLGMLGLDNIGQQTVKELTDFYSGMVGRSRMEGREPGFMDRVADFFSGWFGGFVQNAAAALLGGPLGLLGRLGVGAAIGYGRSAISGGMARGTGLGGLLDDALSGRGLLGRVTEGHTTVAEAFSVALDRATDRISGLTARAGGGGFNGRLGGFDMGGQQFAVEALSMSAGQRASAARGDLAADLGRLRSDLGSSWRDVVGTGQSIMASAPRFHQGGRFTIGGSGEQPVFFVGEGGEEVTVRPRGRAASAAGGSAELLAAVEGLARLNAAGFERLLAEMRGLRGDIVTLGRRLAAAT